MAILESQTQTGLAWANESIALFKRAPRKWLMLSFAYIFFFLMLPTLPGLQLLSLVTILAWPVFLAFALSLYRNVDINLSESLSQTADKVKPYVALLVGLGLLCFAYGVLVGLLINSDIQGLLKFAHAKVITNEHMMQVLTVITKTMLFMLPLFMMTWFSPMLIKQNGYRLIHAIKSSIAGCLQYLVALSLGWLVLTLAIVAFMLVLGLFSGLIGAFIPVLGSLLMPVALLFSVIVATALMLAFQYISYRDVFRAATVVG